MHDKIVWETLEHEHKERTPDWYWAVGIIALCIAVISVIYKNYIFAFFIILAAAVLFMFSQRKPDMLDIEINQKGIKIKDEFYHYKMIKSFYIENQGNEKKLLIHTNRVLMPIIALSFDQALEDRIKMKLLTHSREEEMKEPVSQRIMESLGF